MSHVALTKCFFCLGDGMLLLHKNLKDISEAHGKVCNMEPCQKCQEYMKQGIILIIIDETKCTPDWGKPKPGATNWMPNPYRTGHFAVIKDEAFVRMYGGEESKWALDHRWAFMDIKAAKMTGIIKDEQPLVNQKVNDETEKR